MVGREERGEAVGPGGPPLHSQQLSMRWNNRSYTAREEEKQKTDPEARGVLMRLDQQRAGRLEESFFSPLGEGGVLSLEALLELDLDLLESPLGKKKKNPQESSACGNKNSIPPEDV